VAQSCNALADALNVSVDDLVDGSTYVRVPIGKLNTSNRNGDGYQWRLLAGLADLNMTGPLSGLYVVRDRTNQPRVGVVVVKTGRIGLVSNTSPEMVTLVRRDNSICALGMSDKTVRAEVYDGFHDYGRQDYDTASLATLNEFHTLYGKGCKRRTDEDRGGFFRHVSNRASFSFNEDVVDRGGYTNLETAAANFRLGRVANAQQVRKLNEKVAIGFSNRQAEVKPYETAIGLMCLSVTIPSVDPGSFYRTNDLAAPIPKDKRRENRH